MFIPIIPVYARMPASWRTSNLRAPFAKDVLRGYLEAFDPDVLVQFAKDVPYDLGDVQLEIINPSDVWNGAGNLRHCKPNFGIGVFDVMGEVYRECFRYKAKYPLSVILPKIPEKLSLFWASVFGEYDGELLSEIERQYGDPLEIDRPTIAPASLCHLTEDSVLFPRLLTAWGLTSTGLGFRKDSCIYFMDASSLQDVIDFWNLRATGRRVLPLPRQYLQEESTKRMVEKYLAQEKRLLQRDPEMWDVVSFIRGRHTTMDEMVAYVRSLNINSVAATKKEPGYQLQHWYPRIWDEWTRVSDGGVADVYADGERSIDIDDARDLEMRLEPLLPNFAKNDRIDNRGLCVNELDLSLFGADEYLAEVYPKDGGQNLARAISGFSLRGEWRIGRHGLVKIVRSSWSEQRTVPQAEKIFFAWLEDHGWQAELSPPGILAKQILKRAGGHPRLIADKSVLALIEHMNGGSVRKDGSSGPELRISSDRELAVGEVKSRIKGHYENLLRMGVFKLGLRAKCPTCQRNTWFSLSSLRESMECPKCLCVFPAIGNVDRTSGNWYYRTTGPFSVPNYADGAYTVLLTLDALCGHMFSLMRATAVPSFLAKSTGKPDLEADLAMFWKEASFGSEREGLLFGECKTFGLFEGKDISRMSYLARTFPGAVLVFSTLRDGLTPKEVRALKRIAKAGRKNWKADRPVNPVLILTAAELLSWRRPPYCWDKSTQDRFQHVHDLLSLCDASQQLYLNLPPWHVDRRQRFLNRHKRKSDTPVAVHGTTG